MGKGHELRWGGLAGLGAVALAIIARLVLGSSVPAITDTPSMIAAFLSDHHGQILAAAVLCAVAAALLLWFGAPLATAFRAQTQTVIRPRSRSQASPWSA
jgi:hypothetical protein